MHWEHFLEYFKNEKNFYLISVNQRERYYQEMVIFYPLKPMIWLAFDVKTMVKRNFIKIEFYRRILVLNEGGEWSMERPVEVECVRILSLAAVPVRFYQKKEY